MAFLIYGGVGLALVMATILIVAVLVNARKAHQRTVHRESPLPGKHPAKRKMEFSKLVFSLVMLSYFIAVVVGVWLSLIDFSQYTTLAMLVGTPTATAIGFYAWKAKAENVIKIKKENPQETEGVTVDPSTII